MSRPSDCRGVPKSNFGLTQAAGEWIPFFDADDLIELDYLEAPQNMAAQNLLTDLLVDCWEELTDTSSVMRQFFCFSHIPKTAGTTFNSIMERNFGDAYLLIPHELYEGPVNAELVRSFVERFPRSKALGGHRISLDLPFDMYAVDLRAIAFVREPLSRLASEYDYVRKLDQLKKPAELQEDTFERFLQAIAVKPDSWFRDTQYRFLRKDLHEIGRLVETKKLLLFTTENFKKACICLEILFPEDFSDNSFVEKNVNKTKSRVNRDWLDAKVVEKVLGQDQQLHALARKSEQVLFAEIGRNADWDELQLDFRRRCLRRKLFIIPLESFFMRGRRFVTRMRLRGTRTR